MSPKESYQAKILNIFTKHKEPAFTHAFSHLKAYHNLAARYPYPPYSITEVTNISTKVTMEE